jgi:hypothetical protein
MKQTVCTSLLLGLARWDRLWPIGSSVVFAAILLRLHFWLVLGLLEDEEGGLDDEGDDDEGERDHQRLRQVPAEEVGADVVAGESGHEEGEDEGHGEGDGVRHLLHALPFLLLLEVVVAAFPVWAHLVQKAQFALALELLDESALLGRLPLLLDELVHLGVSDDIVAADLSMQGLSQRDCDAF